jgi:hypothetical protein
VEDDVLVDAELLRTELEATPVRLTVPFSDVRVRGADDHVDRRRVTSDDTGERIDDVLDPFVRREEPEGEEL